MKWNHNLPEMHSPGRALHVKISALMNCSLYRINEPYNPMNWPIKIDWNSVQMYTTKSHHLAHYSAVFHSFCPFLIYRFCNLNSKAMFSFKIWESVWARRNSFVWNVCLVIAISVDFIQDWIDSWPFVFGVRCGVVNFSIQHMLWWKYGFTILIWNTVFFSISFIYEKPN